MIRFWRNIGRPFRELFCRPEMDDQRMIRWATFGTKNLLHRFRLGGIGRQSINGFGRYRNQLALLK
ncbi:Uncharacterised protein [Vibrio cholerae]|nr:Uncharacterised protein [Vibrio cholerae]